jgi:hypothetical protein
VSDTVKVLIVTGGMVLLFSPAFWQLWKIGRIIKTAGEGIASGPRSHGASRAKGLDGAANPARVVDAPSGVLAYSATDATEASDG